MHLSNISAFPPPAAHQAMQWFLGMVNFYRKFISGVALILWPLTDAFQGDPKDFSWSAQMDSAFISDKSASALVPTLVHLVPSACVSQAVETSASHMGAVFQQLVQGSWGPLAFYSKKLSSTFNPEFFSCLLCQKALLVPVRR